MSVCIFCLRHRDRNPPGSLCTYGMHHEYPVVTKGFVPQESKRDAKLCTKCGLHPRNPASATNGCVHAYVPKVLL